LLSVDSIRVQYGLVEAIHGVSLRVGDGAIVSLIGANGAGKTTTLRAISGLSPLSSGSVSFDGERIDKLPSAQRVIRGVALVPQAGRPFPGMSVIENLLMGAYRRKDRAGIAVDLEKVFRHFPRLRDRRKQRASTLSGGERQMLCIGRGLMTHPKLLMMDEPSHGLAPKLVTEIAHIIREINAEGVAILLVEQNARLALTLADSAYCLETGRVALSGKCADLVDNDKVRGAYLGV
jgi:branched-chain amino acid transport system ATP-binding protein